MKELEFQTFETTNIKLELVWEKKVWGQSDYNVTIPSYSQK